jgi:hypothetical protein
VKTEAEQQVWNECSRLIANAVIYYNGSSSLASADGLYK